MSQLTPEQLEQRAAKLFASGRAEVGEPAAKAATIDKVLAGQVVPLDRRLLDPKGGTGAVALRRWIGAGIVGALLAGSLYAWWSGRSSEPEPSVAVGPGPGAPAPAPAVAPPPPLTTPPVAAPPPVAPPPPVESPAAEAPPAHPPPHRSPLPADTEDALARELSLIDEARHLMREHPEAAMVTLAAHAKTFPQGAMRLEADLLRVEGLLRLGKRPAAEALGRRLVAQDPEGLVSQRVKRLLDGP